MARVSDFVWVGPCSDADRVMAKKSPDVPGVDQRRRIEPGTASLR